MPFADELISAGTAEGLAQSIAGVRPASPLPRLRAAAGELEDLGLRQRADLLRDALLEDIPGDYAELARVVSDARREDPSFRGWMIWPVTSAVASKAVADGGTEAFDDAMGLMAELTGLLTSEFAIRTLLRHDLDRALAIIRTWTSAEDADVRRLASEGTRPYLPWSVRVPALTRRPGATVPILDALRRDESEYVRRSVANHLNDLSRDDPARVVETAARWLEEPDANTLWVARHGLRTLIKRGDADALAVMGFPSVEGSLQIDGPHLDRVEVALGESLRFTATVRNIGEEDVRLAIDYVVHHRKANGTLAPKTFKLTTATLAPGQHTVLQRTHSFRPISTRRYYAGPHAISLQINGVATDPVRFELTAG